MKLLNLNRIQFEAVLHFVSSLAVSPEFSIKNGHDTEMLKSGITKEQFRAIISNTPYGVVYGKSMSNWKADFEKAKKNLPESYGIA